MNQLYDVMYEFDFSLPPDYALVIRALGSLEGTAKVLDPDFKVVESAYPFVIARLLADPNPDMRRILRELLIHNDGSIRWNRLERLIAAISEQSDESDPDTDDNPQNSASWKSFDIRAVVSATEDLLDFMLSDKGLRVRIFLLRDIVTVTDTFLDDEVVGCGGSNDDFKAKKDSDVEERAMLARVTLGLSSLRRAVNKAPELWSAMLLRLASRPEFRQFLFDIVSTLFVRTAHKMPQAFWISMSRILHRMVDVDEGDDSV